MHTCTLKFKGPSLHTLTSKACYLTVSQSTCSCFPCVCLCMCACLHTEPILLNPVSHCLNTSLESFHCHTLSDVAEAGSGVAGRLGLPPIRPSDWPTAGCRIQLSPFGGFCEWMVSGGPNRDMIIQVDSLKGAQLIVYFLVCCHIKILYFILFLVVSDQMLLSSDLLFQICFCSYTLTQGLAKA